MAEEAPKANFRIKTWLDQDERGHFCVVGLWTGNDVGEAGDDRTDCDQEFWLGPFPTRKKAKYELKHGVREIVAEILQVAKDKHEMEFRSYAQGDL